MMAATGFNTQPPEGGWFNQDGRAIFFDDVSTHSRPKAAGNPNPPHPPNTTVSTHSRPKAAGGAFETLTTAGSVSTHSRPKAAGLSIIPDAMRRFGFNTQPPEGGWG